LSYIKKRNIVHRDLKLENVMIAQEEDCLDSDNAKIKRDKYLKLADFGWACQFFSEKRKTLCGTPECNKYEKFK
jgi:serine/threonine protein kinase